MLGNDIVSICSEKNLNSFQRKKYIEYCFSFTERTRIISLGVNIAFLFWSAKESAYKCFVKMGLREKFNPFDYSCTIQQFGLQNEVTGVVQYKSKSLSFISKITDQYIHTICESDHRYGAVSKQILHIDAPEMINAGQILRNNLCKLLISDLKIPGQYEIRNNRDTNIPLLYIDGKIYRAVDLSLSHDECFLAYCYQKLEA